MPVTFKTKAAPSGASTKDLSHLQNQVREALKLNPSAMVDIGLSRTTIRWEGIHVELPFGIPQVKNASPKLGEVHQRLLSLMQAPDPYSDFPKYSAASVAAGGVPIPAWPFGEPITAEADMEDQLWVEHVAKELFPGTLHLYQATELYQPVLGTSGGSVYKTCFIGPELRVAARIKASKVSFRATTNSDACPSGPIADVFKRLGVTQEHSNRLTCHAVMNGPFDAEHAHEYRALFGAFYAALKPWITSNFPGIGHLSIGVK